nr:family 1 glycosylhydrolase [Candidatus Sigynarchaeota archaeon]
MVSFPNDFKFGAATAAYQVEGATTEDGRGKIMYDVILKQPLFYFADPRVACDFYHRYKEDVQLMADLGLQTFRFSIAWPRVVPDGDGDINEKGLRFYSNLVDELVRHGIEPTATLYHFDLPMTLYRDGGWRNKRTVDAFTRYAKACFDRLGNRVTRWITFNEPWVDQYMSYYIIQKLKLRPDKAIFAESLNGLHNMFTAHAKTVLLLKDTRPENKIAITLNLGPVKPVVPSTDNDDAARRCDDFINDWHLSPALRGEYPPQLLERYSTLVGAPAMAPGDDQLLREASKKMDAIGVNYYAPFIVRASKHRFPLYYGDIRSRKAPEWANNGKVEPAELHALLVRIATKYNNPEIWITENGCSFGKEAENDIKDQWRIKYLADHLREVKRAMDNGARVRRYYVWSFMDNLEWILGYREQYGLVRVDRKHGLARSMKASGKWYAGVIKNRGFE